jgi:hypothetical protein
MIYYFINWRSIRFANELSNKAAWPSAALISDHSTYFIKNPINKKQISRKNILQQYSVNDQVENHLLYQNVLDAYLVQKYKINKYRFFFLTIYEMQH